ncbi:MAG: hypothetical protein ACJ74Y_00255, partial [Bryobacteraceae bacterium]
HWRPAGQPRSYAAQTAKLSLFGIAVLVRACGASDRPTSFDLTDVGPFLGQGLFYATGAGDSTIPFGGGNGTGNGGVSGGLEGGLNGVITPEPGSLPLLLLAALLGSPTLIRTWRNRAATRRK